jgi:hypothetical protein
LKAVDPEEVQRQTDRLLAINFRIHYHVRTQQELMEVQVARMVAVCSSRVRGRPSSPVPRGREGSDTLLLPDHKAASFFLELPDAVRVRAQPREKMGPAAM